MTITGAIVLYAVIWALTMLVVLPVGLRTLGDEGEEGPASAPINPDIKRKTLRVTAITTVIWAILCGIIISGFVSINDIDIWGQM